MESLNDNFNVEDNNEEFFNEFENLNLDDLGENVNENDVEDYWLRFFNDHIY